MRPGRREMKEIAQVSGIIHMHQFRLKGALELGYLLPNLHQSTDISISVDIPKWESMNGKSFVTSFGRRISTTLRCYDYDLMTAFTQSGE
jgi:hypothetical protein